MKIELSRIGLLEKFLPPREWVDVPGPVTLRDFLKWLERVHGSDLITEILAGEELKSYVTLLLNGKSTRILPRGLDTYIEDGDRAAICLMVDGG